MIARPHRSPPTAMDPMSPDPPLLAPLPEPVQRLVEARHHDPFAVLGRHAAGSDVLVRALIPVPSRSRSQARRSRSSAFRAPTSTSGRVRAAACRCATGWRGPTRAGDQRVRHDPYCFPLQLGDLHLYLYGEGRHWHGYGFLGAHPHIADGIEGVLFCAWVPNAERVSVVGDFNGWDGRAHPMRSRGGSGVGELFIPTSPWAACTVRTRVRLPATRRSRATPTRAASELRPETAAVVTGPSAHAWQDEGWLARRRDQDGQHAPLSIYEVHLGSWARATAGRFVNYRDLAHRLADYVADLGFSTSSSCPSPNIRSTAPGGIRPWVLRPDRRFGAPHDLMYFVDHLHQRGIGVMLDSVPAHFPSDEHGLALFDGTPLYEHADPRRGDHRTGTR